MHVYVFYGTHSLHTIPCVGFQAEFGAKKFIFSADHYNDPKHFHDMYDRKLIGAGRRDQLLDFNWDADVIFHEMGVPPIHTPASFLTNLPDDVKERLYVIHVADKDVPDGLKKAM